MQKIINQIYWGPVQYTYMAGTEFEKFPDNFVYIKNKMMASGKKIKSWYSMLDYQRDKEVPRLPLLVNGKRYKIVLFLQSFPEDTLIYRLNFFGIQGTIIKQITFSETTKEFVYPEKAKSYSFEIFNAGCEELHFKRMQIAPASVDDDAFEDVSFTPVRKAIKKRQNLVLVADGKRTRLTPPTLKHVKSDMNLMILNVSWQFHGALTDLISVWIETHIVHGVTIFSTDKKLDQAALDVRENYPQVNVITAKSMNFEGAHKKLLHDFYREDIYDPDWFVIAQRLEDYFGE